MSYKPIDRDLKTASVAVLKSTERYVTVTSVLCEIDAGEGTETLALISAFV